MCSFEGLQIIDKQTATLRYRLVNKVSNSKKKIVVAPTTFFPVKVKQFWVWIPPLSLAGAEGSSKTWYMVFRFGSKLS